MGHRNDNTAHRVSKRLAICGSEQPDFLGIDFGIYLANGKSANVLYFDLDKLKIKNKKGTNEVLILKDSNVIAGENAFSRLECGSNIFSIGDNNGEYVNTSNNLIIIGNNSVRDCDSVGSIIALGDGVMGKCGRTNSIIAIGDYALEYIQDESNIAIGPEAGRNIKGSITNHNIIIGKECMKNVDGSTIGVIAMGTKLLCNASGNNFQSVYIGDKIGHNLKSHIISSNVVCLGIDLIKDASNISDLIVVGAMNANNATGVKSIVLGIGSCNNMKGSLNGDIIMGFSAGENRTYSDSHVIFMGNGSGSGSEGAQQISFGTNSGKNMKGDNIVAFGESAGEDAEVAHTLMYGFESGMLAKGVSNVYAGKGAGKGVEGNRNIILGESNIVGDKLNDSVILGTHIFAKGKDAIIAGRKAASNSTGFVNGEVILGPFAGAGHQYGVDINETKGLIFIGPHAGHGNDESPVNSRDTVCLGKSAGHSPTQEFIKCVMVGNYSGSYAGKVVNGTFVGDNSGVGASGEDVVYLGTGTGFNVKGNRNILIGPRCGDQSGSITAEMNDVLAIGCGNRPTILGDLLNGNIMLNSTKSTLDKWTNGKGTLGFMYGERPSEISEGLGLVYTVGKHLEWGTSLRNTIITFPYKIVVQGDISKMKFTLNKDVSGGTLLDIKCVPSTRPEYVLNESIMLNYNSGEFTIQPIKNTLWKVSMQEDIMVIECSIPLQGICYMEIVGVHVLKNIK